MAQCQFKCCWNVCDIKQFYDREQFYYYQWPYDTQKEIIYLQRILTGYVSDETMWTKHDVWTFIFDV